MCRAPVHQCCTALQPILFYLFQFYPSENKSRLSIGTTPPSSPTIHPHSHTISWSVQGAGRNVTAITNPVVSVSGTTAATQLTFRMKAHTHTTTTPPHRRTAQQHISGTSHLKRKSQSALPLDFILFPERVCCRIGDERMIPFLSISVLSSHLLTRTLRRDVDSSRHSLFLNAQNNI